MQFLIVPILIFDFYYLLGKTSFIWLYCCAYCRLLDRILMTIKDKNTKNIEAVFEKEMKL